MACPLLTCRPLAWLPAGAPGILVSPTGVGSYGGAGTWVGAHVSGRSKVTMWPMDHFPQSRVVLPPGAWPSVLDFLCERFPAIDRDTWADRMQRGLVESDGRTADRLTPYRPGTVVTYRREVPAEPRIPF